MDLVGEKQSYLSKFQTQHLSAMVLATLRHSTSALDREMTPWRLDDQEMRLLPRKIQYTKVEQRETWQPPQLVLEYAQRSDICDT